jgi:putative hydrolase of HD superfamily
MINKKLALKIFEGFSIVRWNDLPRPFDLVEMDRAGEKMILAYLIGKYEEKKGGKIDWNKIIFSGFFELLKKIALSDIKASVHRLIKEKHPEEFKKLNLWVVDQYKDIIENKEILRLFREYIDAKENLNDINYKILRAAHKLSTIREFELIKKISSDVPRVLEIEIELNSDIMSFLDLECVKRIFTKQPPYSFLCTIEQLRHQTRWSQTPRIPKTSVLGHSAYVAFLTILITDHSKLCNKRFYNNFFCALFHDLPEAVTRDIISPVKNATKVLPSIIKEIEEEIVNKELFPKVDVFFRNEIEYFTNNEFDNRVVKEDNTEQVSFDDLSNKYNEDIYSPVDGNLIKVADHLAAFIEADRSIHHGIKSSHLEDGKNNIMKRYQDSKIINGVDVKSIFNEWNK